MHVAWTETFEEWIADHGGDLLVHPPPGGVIAPALRVGAPVDPARYRRFGAGAVRLWVRRDVDFGPDRALSLDFLDGAPVAAVVRTPRRGN